MGVDVRCKIIRGVADLQEGRVAATISTGSVDRDGEVILPSAWEKRLDAYLANPVVLWAHSHWDPPVGKMVDYNITDEAFTAITQFAIEEYDFANLVYTLYKNGYLNAFSVGFIPHGFSDEKIDEAQGGITYTDVELVEYSAVPVPSNRDAVVEIYPQIKSHLSPTLLDLYEKLVEEELASYKPVDLGKDKSVRVYVPRWFDGEIKVSEEEKEERKKGATPFADLPVDEESDWNSAEARQRVREWATVDDEVDWEKYRQAFFWYDPEAADELGGYKLPFADVVDGELVAIWRGIVAAMAALNGARGGVDIPEEDREDVYEHIVKYYEKVGQEAPPLKTAEELSYESYTLKEVADALRDAAKALQAVADAFLSKAKEFVGEVEEGENDPEEISEEIEQRIAGELEAMMAKLKSLGGERNE